ncbi:MAG: hypothetical protein R2873_22485 [Caldilineaceae bacterium]
MAGALYDLYDNSDEDGNDRVAYGRMRRSGRSSPPRFQRQLRLRLHLLQLSAHLAGPRQAETLLLTTPWSKNVNIDNLFPSQQGNARTASSTGQTEQDASTPVIPWWEKVTYVVDNSRVWMATSSPASRWC